MKTDISRSARSKATALIVAVGEAERFIARAKAAVKELETDWTADFSSKEVAAAKRASMDLTRSLVGVRRP